MNIKVLGPGCNNCKKLLEVTKEAVNEIDKKIEIEYITDLKRMVSYGMMSSPALVIDEKLVSQGKLLKKDEIVQLIKNN